MDLIGAWSQPLHHLVSQQLYLGMFMMFKQPKEQMGDLDESPIGGWLALLILVISSLHVYVSLWVFLWSLQWRNRSMAFSFLGYCISHLWTGWNALNSPSLPSYTNLAVGVLLFMLLLRHSPARIALALSRGNLVGLALALSAGNLVSGHWLFYARTLPLFHFHTSTLGS